jgi:predicted permease
MLARLRSLWRNLRHRDRVDSDLDHEVNAVFDILVDEKVKSGLSIEQARRAATLELGRVHSITQQVREERTGATVDALLKDVRYGARTLRANPGFTLVIALSLGVAIGANSALFSVANALLLRTLPVPEVHTLNMVRYEPRESMAPRVSYQFFQQLRAGYPEAAGLAAMSRVSRMRAQQPGAEIETANVQLVSGEYFGVLRLQPLAGRLLSVDDNTSMGAHPVAVVSESYWRRRFASAPDVNGRTLVLNGAQFTIVGVAPQGFTGVWLESPVDVWIPAMMQADVRYIQNFSQDGSGDMLKPWIPQDAIKWLELITRAARPDGQEAAALNTVLRPVVIAQADRLTDPEERRRALAVHLVLSPFAHGTSALRNQFRTPLFALMTMVALLLLIACANTANLLLARAGSRQREMAVRLSIGASRARVITQLLIESVLLGTLAALVGLLIAPLASEFLVRMTMGVESGPLPFSVGIDWRVLGFTALVTLLTSLLFGFAPAWRATDLPLTEALKTGGRTTAFGARMNLSKSLVIAQVALSLMLAVGAGLFARSFGNLASLPLGFEPHVLWVSMNPMNGGYTQEELPGLYRRIIDRVEALPSVESATIAMCGLMTGCRSAADGLAISGYNARPGEQIYFQENKVATNYFPTVGMTLAAGRDFTPQDSTTKGAQVVIINEAAARRYFKDRNPVGERMGYDAPTIEIVGVVRDARVNTVREDVPPMSFYPLDATPSYVGTMHVRAQGNPDVVAAEVRKALAEIEPKLPVDRATPITTLAAGTLRQERVIARLSTLLGLLALGLASLGIYGLMSYAVKQRTAELGIRFALGAPRPRVLWMVFRESMLLMAAGLIIGIPLLMAASRTIKTMLFGVNPSDPLTIAGAMAVLIVVGAVSSYLPAWRASRVDPLTALRTE